MLNNDLTKKQAIPHSSKTLTRVLIFGVGEFGIQYMEQIKKPSDDISVVGFLDNNEALHGALMFGKYPCRSPKEVHEIEYDKIVIAAFFSSRPQMLEQLLGLGISRECIEFYPQEIEIHDPRIVLIRDFSRYAAEQGISGNVAECGVNDGAFAQYMNRFFHDKKLYLFDTFEGFSPQDIEVERKIADESFLKGEFNHTGGWNHSIELVMSKMTFPNNVIIKKGWVPESLTGVDDTFCFVNLDMDLYHPMLAATSFFWERMSIGGVLLLHDYYHPELPGVKRAVEDFELKLGRKVPKTPTSGGSFALIKDS